MCSQPCIAQKSPVSRTEEVSLCTESVIRCYTILLKTRPNVFTLIASRKDRTKRRFVPHCPPPRWTRTRSFCLRPRGHKETENKKCCTWQQIEMHKFVSRGFGEAMLIPLIKEILSINTAHRQGFDLFSPTGYVVSFARSSIVSDTRLQVYFALPHLCWQSGTTKTWHA